MADGVFKRLPGRHEGPHASRPRMAERTKSGDHGAGALAAGLGRDRPGRHHAQRPGAVPPGAPGPALCRRQGPRVRARRPGGGQGGAGRRRHRAGRGPGRRGRRTAPARRARPHPALERVRCRRRRHRVAYTGSRPRSTPPRAIEQFSRAARRLGQRPRSTSRWTPGCTGSARPRRRSRRSCAPSPTIRSCASRACGPTWPWPTATRRGPRLHPGPARAFDGCVPTWPGGRRPSDIIHAANTAGAIAFPRRATAWCAAASGCTATCPARR
jgi:hypothetical protein